MNQEEQEKKTADQEHTSATDADMIPAENKKRKKKKSGFGKGFAAGAVVMAAICAAVFVMTSGIRGFSGGDQLLDRNTENKIRSLAEYIQTNYYEDVDTDKLQEGLYAGLFDNLDVYSQYYTSEIGRAHV